MARPDPSQISRRPMARAGREIAFARARHDGEPLGRAFTVEGDLDVEALQRRIDASDSVIEGRPYRGGEGEVFFGSAVIRVPADDEVPGDAERLADALVDDLRGRRVLRDRVYRELARLLGPRTPAAFEMEHGARVEGAFVRVDVDIEAPLPAAAQG